ncbi:competence type IV pilus minor pilin ComGF [Salisediminibacterium beveridgei]|uniref:Prepilin-type N-terminal cleavage/methylation domain-containing protein n=1 Tax=Salisediminibacterium beveridgei TaxID=632773 RepID=A0A1D7QUG1_9BACI|nr:competence type IV pilus minor pilin ComGF [Salisediminibacterium beveridgei]AOM82651.1 hypothetical protein BBEV_1286 [Salisediminibacterium beveridgei]
MNGVWKHFNNDQGGFTLIEVMTALVLVTLILTAFTHSYAVWRQLDTTVNQPSEQELLLFQLQLMRLFEMETDYAVSGRSSFDTWSDEHEDTISYSQYRDVIRRRVNQLGHEVLMQRITHFRVFEHPEGLELHLLLDGKQKKWVMYHPGNFLERTEVTDADGDQE